MDLERLCGSLGLRPDFDFELLAESASLDPHRQRFSNFLVGHDLRKLDLIPHTAAVDTNDDVAFTHAGIFSLRALRHGDYQRSKGHCISAEDADRGMLDLVRAREETGDYASQHFGTYTVSSGQDAWSELQGVSCAAGKYRPTSAQSSAPSGA